MALEVQNARKFMLQPAAVATNATTAMVIDTKGYDYCVLDVLLGTGAATTAPTAIAITESDDATTYTAITALTGGVSAGNFTIAAAGGTTTSSVTYATFNIDCRARKRYLQLAMTTGNGEVVGAIANLTRAETSVDGAGTAATQQNASIVVDC